MNQFIRDKFEVILLTVLLAILMTLWVSQGYPEQLNEYVFGTFTAWLAIMRVIQRPSNVKADTVQADNIETANTQSGDIITTDAKANKTREEM